MRGFFIRLIGHKKREEIKKENIKKVFFGSGRIGDYVLKTPFIRELGKVEGLELTIETDNITSELIKYNPYIKEIKILPPKKIKPIKILRILERLKSAYQYRKKFDLYIDFGSDINFFNILYIKILQPRYSIGGDRIEKYGIKKNELTIFNAYKKSELTIFNKYKKNIDHKPGAEFYLDFLEPLKKIFNLDLTNQKYEIHLNELENKYKNYFDKKNYYNLVFNFTGSSKRHTLTFEDTKYFLENIPLLNKKIKIHVLSMPNIYDDLKIKFEKLNLERVELLPKTEKISEAAAILKYADMLFSVDTGVIHIASAFNIPIVEICENDANTLIMFAPKSDVSFVFKADAKENLINFSKDKILEKIKELVENQK
ncbi:MAG: glycosyltransferase family 9 protein [Fusobacteriaceae bacterium]